MDRVDLAGKRLAVLGAAREGASTARWLLAQGFKVTVCDRNAALASEPLYAELTGSSARWVLGDGYLAGLEDYDVLFRSPGLPYVSPEIQAAKAAGVAVSSQTKLFFELCPAPIIGISGTKGKSTVASLLYAMLQQAGRRAYLGGNIGSPPLAFLDDLSAGDVVVLELSSFQLQDLACSPPLAALINLAADHLDHHQDLQEYHEAKTNLIRFQSAGDVAVLNYDDPLVAKLESAGKGKKSWFSRTKKGTDAFWEGETLVLRGVAVPIERPRLPGGHNLSNIAAAALLASELKLDAASIALAVKGFRGLPLHLEEVAQVGGVTYVNDSYASNPTATIAALEAVTAPLVLVCGGQDRGLDLTVLATAILNSSATGVVLLGAAGKRLGTLLSEQSVSPAGGVLPSTIVVSKDDIVPAARALAQPGDTVLFSPAAPSFDWFSDFEDRGAFFSAEVRKLRER